MTDKEKIRAEIERRKSLLTQHSKLTYDLILETFIKEYDDLISFLDTLSEEPDKSLEEAADKYLDTQDIAEMFCGDYEGWQIVDAFKAGAEWQKKQDQETIELAEDHAMLAGMNKEREELMKGAVEGEVYKNGSEYFVVSDFFPIIYGIKDKQKAKLIIIPDDETLNP